MLVTILVVLLILALALYAVDRAPVDGGLRSIIVIVAVVIAIVFIARAAGLA